MPVTIMFCHSALKTTEAFQMRVRIQKRHSNIFNSITIVKINTDVCGMDSMQLSACKNIWILLKSIQDRKTKLERMNELGSVMWINAKKWRIYLSLLNPFTCLWSLCYTLVAFSYNFLKQLFHLHFLTYFIRIVSQTDKKLL